MSTTISDQPRWNAEVTSAKLGNGVDLLSDDLRTLNEKIQAFVQTSFFQNQLTEISKGAKAPFDIQLIFENDTIKLKKKDSHIDHPLTLPTSTSGTSSTSSDATAMKETTDLVKNMANYYLNPPTQKEPVKSTATNQSALSSLGCSSTSIPKADPTTLDAYNIHGIQNRENKFCYANSAYQILANVPSLKTSVIDLNANLAYNEINKGQELVKAVNRFKTTDPFDLNKVYDASEVFEALINSTNSKFPQLTLETTEEFSPSDQNTPIDILPNQSTADTVKMTPSNNEARIFTCNLPLTGDINFKNIIASKLVQIEKSEILQPTNESVTQTTKMTTKFTSQPKQLLIQLGRKIPTGDATNPTTLNDRFIEGIPMVLNLQEYDAIKDPQEPPVLLELKGFTVHKGADSSSGHYIAYFQKENPQKTGEYQWFCANDDNILIVPEAEIIKALGHAHNLYYDDTKIPSTSLNGSGPLLSYTQFLNKSKTPTTSIVNPTNINKESSIIPSNPTNKPLPPATNTGIMKRLKRIFDPKTIFNIIMGVESSE